MRSPGLDLDREDGAALRAHVEDAAPVDHESDLVLGVRVLAREPREHGLEAGQVRADVDDVDGGVAAAGRERVHLGRERAQHLVGGRRVGARAVDAPAFVFDAGRARNAATSASPSIVRPCVGTLTRAIDTSRAGRHGQRAAHDLEQELERLHVAARLGHVAAPRVQPVPAQQQAVTAGVQRPGRP